MVYWATFLAIREKWFEMIEERPNYEDEQIEDEDDSDE